MTAATLADIPCIAGLSELAPRYDALLCDVWGVLIDGKRHFPWAAQALAEFRAKGGTVLLITNASRPSAEVIRQLTGLGLPRDCFDDLVSAGELTLRQILARKGQACFHLGPPRDKGLFEAAGERLGAPVKLVPLEEADYVVCTGLFDERNEDPQDYDDRLALMKSRNLPMLCANPDIKVAVGEDILWCAGALAERFTAMGGEALLAGKPHPPIYHAALENIAERRGGFDKSRALAVGDGAFTDLLGAARTGVDCLFITEGIHAAEIRPHGRLDRNAAAALFLSAKSVPIALARQLVW